MTQASPGLLADLATRPLASATDEDDLCCGLCGLPLTSVRLVVGRRRVEVLSCGPCGWHTRRVDGADATLDDLCDLVRGTHPEPLPDRGRLPATWNRR